MQYAVCQDILILSKMYILILPMFKLISNHFIVAVVLVKTFLVKV